MGFHLVRFGWEGRIEKIEEDSKEGNHSIPDAIAKDVMSSHFFAARAVWRLSDACYDGHGGAVYVNNSLVMESLIGSATKSSRRIVPLGARPQRLESGAYIFAGQAQQNYYHWLLEDLPAVLRSLEVCPEASVVIPKGQPDYVLESLDFFGANVQLMKKRTSCAGSVILAERGHDAGWPHPRDIKAIRDNLTPTRPSNILPKGAIFVSRRNARRRYANAHEIELEMQRLGVRVVYLEEMSFIEQIEVFQGANVVVAEHGAGLSNIVFCSTNTSVVELVSADRAIQCFEVLANHISASYVRVLSDNAVGIAPVLSNERLTHFLEIVRSVMRQSTPHKDANQS